MENKAPAFQFYPKDFVSDVNVVTMTMEERGVYITLLSHCWIEGCLKGGSEMLQAICNNPSNWEKIWEKVSRCFYEKDGIFYHNRLEKEKIKQSEWREKSRLGGIKSGEKRKKSKGGSRVVEPNGNSSSSSSSSIKKNKRLFVETEKPFQLSQLLFNLILKRKPDLKKPDLQEWAKHIDLMIRNDKRDSLIIEEIIRWCQQDTFWQNNILSTAKLRKQFDQLELKMQDDNAKDPEETEKEKAKQEGILKFDGREKLLKYTKDNNKTLMIDLNKIGRPI